MKREVLVVIGIGGIGQAVARRQGAGKSVLLADFNADTLRTAAQALKAAGYAVTTHPVDVSSRESVNSLANTAAKVGDVVQIVHTAGLSPVQASPAAILAVDLVGVAIVLEEFGRVVAQGGAGVVISSMAGYMFPPLDTTEEEALARTPADDVLALPFLSADAVPNSGIAYSIAKRANRVSVQAAAVTWGERGARVNSISPGIILTPLAEEEMAGAGGPNYRRMIETSAAGRVGTSDEVASLAAFLLGPDAAFITGSDVLMDGGVIAALRAGRWTLQS